MVPIPLPARLLLRVGAGTLVCAVAAACAGADNTRSAGPRLPEPAAVQELAVAVGEDPFLRRIPLPGTERSGPEAARESRDVGLRTDGPNPGVFETLTRVTPTFGVGPGLARGWEELSPSRWRFTLQPDVTFHNGAPLDAPAVVDNLESLARRQNRPRGLEPGSASAVDAHTVDVELSVANLRLPEQLADPRTGIQAPGTDAGAGGQPSLTPTGTGPFRFASYTPGEELAVEAYDDYWDGRPRLDALTFLFGPDDDASRLLATREALAVGHIPHRALARVSGRVDRLVTSAPARAVYLLMNVGGVDEWATLQEPALRRAIALALDRDALTQEAWPDHGEPNSTLIPPPVLDTAADRVAAPAHDQESARRLLDEAGWTEGADGVRRRGDTPLELSLITAHPDELGTAAAAVRAQLEDVGVAVEAEETGQAVVDRFARVNEGAFDLFLDLRTQNDANPCALCRFFSVRPGGQLTFSGSVGAGPRADALYEEAFTAPSNDSARRWAADLMSVVVEKEVVAVPLASLPSAWLLSPRVHGFDPAPIPGTQRWEPVWLSE